VCAVLTRRSVRVLAGGLAVTLLAGCAQETATGTVVGAGSGALIGAIATGSGSHAGQNAVIGAIIGGLLGAIVGESTARSRAAVAGPVIPPPPPPPGAMPPPPGAMPPPPPPGGHWAVVSTPPPVPAGTPVPPPDPTRGVVTNRTPWEVHVFIDAPPGSPGPLVLRPAMSAPVNLDVGQHRIVAQAFVDTQFGRRLVGTFDQILAVDPRAPGWTIRFFEANF
jgi:hypothetical protein